MNLTRYELSYPEERPFFLEGTESYRAWIVQFYSRRIGDRPEADAQAINGARSD